MNNHLSLRLTSLLLLLVLGGVGIMAQQKFSVASFGLDQFDLTAQNEQHKKIDGSGSLYAIIKVTSSNPDDDLRAYRFNFGNMNHEVTEHDGELWVYVQRNAKYVTISRQGYTTINKYDLQTTIEAGRTYVMQLSTAPKQIYTQMVMFSVQPADSKATVMVKSSAAGASEDVIGITDESGATAKGLPFGSYTYRVVAEGYHPTEGRFTLNDIAQTHTEQVVLRPKFGTITLRVNSDADIYVNGELKGRRTWTGRLNGGSYQVECRQTNHRPSTQAITVQENETRTIELTTPAPITGMLSVMSQPLGATILVDGQEQGVTPKQLPQLLIGSHTISLKKEGYENASQSFDITENQTTSLNIAMKKGISQTVASSGEDQVFTVTGNGKTVTFKMVRVAGGTFQMGSNDSDANNDEKPVHQVTLSSYSIGETEVTQELWEAVMGKNPSKWKGSSLPVEQVSWEDCQEFITRLNQKTGKRFRLPTEAEWEFAARGGNKSRGYKYSGSNDIGSVAWYTDNSGYNTHAVKTKQPNELGLYDMSGNVWEWCQDWYGRYSSSAKTNPQGPASGSGRVSRGGSWGGNARLCRTSFRSALTPSHRGHYLGFRLAF